MYNPSPPWYPYLMTSPAPPAYTLTFGYRHVTGVPHCPCADPGNYMMMEQLATDPLQVRFTCWCGSRLKGSMDSPEELAEFLLKNPPDSPS